MISILIPNSALPTPHLQHTLGLVLRVLRKGTFPGIPQMRHMVCVREPHFTCPASDC